ncbi:hypothetical protein GF325_14225 [Candidatus Bathyarchaeota archaeon]|nr:hypothetical protein [Candidatus Bathyarchaeota archaeon]
MTIEPVQKRGSGVQEMSQDLEDHYNERFRTGNDDEKQFPRRVLVHDQHPLALQLSFWDPKAGPVAVLIIGNKEIIHALEDGTLDESARMLDFMEVNGPIKTIIAGKPSMCQTHACFAVPWEQIRGGRGVFLVSTYHPNGTTVPAGELSEILDGITRLFNETRDPFFLDRLYDQSMPFTLNLDRWISFLTEVRASIIRLIDTSVECTHTGNIARAMKPKIDALLGEYKKMAGGTRNDIPTPVDHISRQSQGKSQDERSMVKGKGDGENFIQKLWEKVRRNESKKRDTPRLQGSKSRTGSKKTGATMEEVNPEMMAVKEKDCSKVTIHELPSNATAVPAYSPFLEPDGHNERKLDPVIPPRSNPMPGWVKTQALALKERGYTIDFNEKQHGCLAMKLLSTGTGKPGLISLLFTFRTDQCLNGQLKVIEGMLLAAGKPAIPGIHTPLKETLFKNILPGVENISLHGTRVGRIYEGNLLKAILIPLVFCKKPVVVDGEQRLFFWNPPVVNEQGKFKQRGFYLIHEGSFKFFETFMMKVMGAAGESLLSMEREFYHEVNKRAARNERISKYLSGSLLALGILTILALLRVLPVHATYLLFEYFYILAGAQVGLIPAILFLASHSKKEVIRAFNIHASKVVPELPMHHSLDYDTLLSIVKVLGNSELPYFLETYCQEEEREGLQEAAAYFNPNAGRYSALNRILNAPEVGVDEMQDNPEGSSEPPGMHQGTSFEDYDDFVDNSIMEFTPSTPTENIKHEENE